MQSASHCDEYRMVMVSYLVWLTIAIAVVDFSLAAAAAVVVVELPAKLLLDY